MSKLSTRLILLQYRSFLGCFTVFVGLFFFIHFLFVPLFVSFKDGSPVTEEWHKTQKEDISEKLFYFKPFDVITTFDMWQEVNDPLYGHKVYLYSAYFDDRPNLPHYYIRVVAIAQNSAECLSCLLWYRNDKNPDVVPANFTFIENEVVIEAKTHQGLVLSCEVPSGRWPPEAVSIISRESVIPTNLVKVELPVRAQVVGNMAVCVPASFGSIPEAKFIEWIEILKIMKVSKVIMYDAFLDAKSLKTIKHYAEDGYLELHNVTFPTIHVNEFTLRLLVSALVNDCFYRNMMKYNKILVMDVDEIIIPRIHDTYPEMLVDIDNQLQPNPGRSYKFKTVSFWLDLAPITEDSSFMTMNRYVKRTPPSSSTDTERTITDTQVCLAMNAHKCQELLPKFKNQRDWLLPVSTNISLLHQYKKCDLDTKDGTRGLCNKTFPIVEIDDAGIRFAHQVVNKVMEKLYKLDLVKEYMQISHSDDDLFQDEQPMDTAESARKKVEDIGKREDGGGIGEKKRGHRKKKE